jgi:vancomycin permeability regulator SanA
MTHATSRPRLRKWSVRILVALVFGGLAADAVVLLCGRQGVETAPAPHGPAPRWIVVPGASVHRDGTLSGVLKARMETATLAAQAWPEARLLLSGTAIPGGYSEPEAMRRWVLERGIAPERIVLDRSGTDTRATIRNLGAPSGDLLIVSQGWHLPRALWSARRRGWNASGLVAPATGWSPRIRLREHVVRAVYFLAP